MVGPLPAAAAHRHHAAQIACGLDGPIAVRSPEDGERSGDLILIPPDHVHDHGAFGAAAVLFLDPESAEWRRFADGRAAGLALLAFRPALRGLARGAGRGRADAARSFCDAIVGPSDGAPGGDDAVVRQVCELVRRGLDRRVTLAALADAVHRSPSRLAHRVRDALGLPLRRYVLWCRLRAAADAALRGASWTAAAQAGGFADSAHLSRTFRAHFGIAPSLLLARERFEVTFIEPSVAVAAEPR